MFSVEAQHRIANKTEQSDLLQGMYGRNGEAPLPILASIPSGLFDIAIEAWRLAVECMVPVMILSDGYIANGSEPWKIPEMSHIEPIKVSHPEGTAEDEPFLPYARDENLARPWAIPGTPGLMHRVGGLEKEAGSGNVSYDPANHQHMTDMRAAKVARIADRIPPQQVSGPDNGDVLVLSWGGTYGLATAVNRCRANGIRSPLIWDTSAQCQPTLAISFGPSRTMWRTQFGQLRSVACRIPCRLRRCKQSTRETLHRHGTGLRNRKTGRCYQWQLGSSPPAMRPDPNACQKSSNEDSANMCSTNSIPQFYC